MTIDKLPVIENSFGENWNSDIPVIERAEITIAGGRPHAVYVGGLFREDEGTYHAYDQLIYSFNAHEEDGALVLTKPTLYIPSDDVKDYQVIEQR